MSNLIIKSSLNCIDVDFGVYAGTVTPFGILPKCKIYQKKNVEFEFRSDNTIYALLLHSSNEFHLSLDGASGSLIVDSIDGRVPTTNTELYEMLSETINNTNYGNEKTEVNVATSITSVKLVDKNINRYSLVIKNNSNKKMWISTINPAVVNVGIDLAAGDVYFEDKFKGDLFCIWESAATGVATVIEVK
jgi:hypothetical protein